MNNLGTILELTQSEAKVFSPQRGFAAIKRQPDMFVGQQVEFQNSDIRNPKSSFNKYISVISSAAAVVLCVFMYFQFFYSNQSNNIYAYLDVDINPSMEFIINNQQEVMEVTPFNSDAKVLINDLELKGTDIRAALVEVVKKSKDYGYISEDQNIVLVSAALNDVRQDYEINKEKDELNLNNLLKDSKKVISELNMDSIKPQVVEITPESHKEAVKNNMSMGKYLLYEKAKIKGLPVTIEEFKTGRLSDIIAKVGIDTEDVLDYDGDESKDVAFVNTEKPKQTETIINTATPVAIPSSGNIPTKVPSVIKTPGKVETSTPVYTPEVTKEPNLGMHTPIPINSIVIPTNTPLPANTFVPPNTPTTEPIYTNTAVPTIETPHTPIPTIEPIESSKAKGKPGLPHLFCYDQSKNSSYRIYMEMWSGNNGTQWELYENSRLVYSGQLEDDSPNNQKAYTEMNDKAPGLYQYHCKLINSFGETTSADINIYVK